MSFADHTVPLRVSCIVSLIAEQLFNMGRFSESPL